MIRCAQCGHSNPVGAVFCVECGRLLIGQVEAKQRRGPDASGVGVRGPGSTTNAWATLYVQDGSKTFRLAQREEFTLGRGDETRGTRPDIDLAPFRAYTNGVSRMHAVIRRRGGQIVLMDLGSANGTYVNGRRLRSQQEAGLVDGDMIALGALKIRIRVKTSTREGRKEA